MFVGDAKDAAAWQLKVAGEASFPRMGQPARPVPVPIAGPSEDQVLVAFYAVPKLLSSLHTY
jgi:hypothetical protein